MDRVKGSFLGRNLLVRSTGIVGWRFFYASVCTLALLAGRGRSVAADEPPAATELRERATFTAEQIEFFERQVRPILVEHCFECHSAKAMQPKGGLRLDSRAAILRGGDTGPAAVPGKPQESLLVDAINYGETYQMPPKSQLPKEQRDILIRWVELGLPWPSEEASVAIGDGRKEEDVLKRASSHWSWRPVRRPALPAVRDRDWPRDPIDLFILARLEAAQMSPAKDATRAEWLRRVTFDLIGLPPTPEELDAFLADNSDDAYEHVVDRLLASPQFAERWARHWLDLVRYAESRGHEFDYDIPNAFEYRDYVIRALLQDLPYDQFVREQIAGDLIYPPRLHPIYGWNESVLGTGFWYLGEWVHSPVDIRKDECDRVDNMLDVFGKTFLGLTIACARCHEHKFDAITQSDYYALAGFLRSSTYRQAHFETMEHNRSVAEELALWEKKVNTELDRSFYETLAAGRTATHKVIRAAAHAYRNLANDGLVGSQNAQKSPDREAHWQDAIQQSAQRWEVEARWVTEWVRELDRASHDAAHPLHALALAASAERSTSTDSGRTGDQLPESSLAAWIQRQLADQSERQAQWQSITTVWHFGRDVPQQWIPWMVDGFAYGAGPQRAGSWIVDDAAPGLRCASYTSARFRPAWHKLARAEGVAAESGRLGAWDRAGKIVRTATFQLGAQPFHYLVRGLGVAYVVVDSHRMINGPLHGNLVLEFRVQEETPRWITHDLRRYAGHVAHIEFHPLPGERLEVVAVVQGAAPPPWPSQTFSHWLAERLNALQATSLESVIAAYDAVFDALGQAWAQRASPERNDAPMPEVFGALADWLLKHDTLLDHQRSVSEQLRAIVAHHFGEYESLVARIRSQGRTAPAMWDGNGFDEWLLIRGNPKTPAQQVARRFLSALAGLSVPISNEGSGRQQLAEQLVDPNNPFTARVYVNRLWHHLMGRGIVASVDNFGVLGELPSHPELLDYLAAEFISCGWSTKTMIRRIVLSHTYRMSSSPADAEAELRDPQNQLWHRMPLKRLEGEALRDAMLAISGRWNTAMYGPSVPVHLTPFMQGRGRPGTSGPLDGAGRRSVYLAVRRNFLSPFMLAFDTPQPFSTVGRRSVSNVPAQALIMLNDPFVAEQARRWAERLLTVHNQCRDQDSFDHALVRAYREAFTRLASSDELTVARTFFAEQGKLYGLSPTEVQQDVRVWADFCHALWNAKEFLFVP